MKKHFRMVMAVLSLFTLVSPSAAAVPVNVPAAIVERLRERSPEQAVAMRDLWEITGVYVDCAGALPHGRKEVPVLACQWGEAANLMTEHGLFWQEGARWRFQPYPSEGVRGNARVTRLYQSGNNLMVIMDVARTQTRGSEQPQWLRRTAGGWQVVWLPGEWAPFNAEVEFEGDSLSRFLVRGDRFLLPEAERAPFVGEFGRYLEQWERVGSRYVRRSRTEAPSSAMAVVHLVTALSHGDDAAAMQWAMGGNVLEAAKAQGIVHAATLGFREPRPKVQTMEGRVYQLETNTYDGKPSWDVTVINRQGWWRVSAIRERL